MKFVSSWFGQPSAPIAIADLPIRIPLHLKRHVVDGIDGRGRFEARGHQPGSRIGSFRVAVAEAMVYEDWRTSPKPCIASSKADARQLSIFLDCTEQRFSIRKRKWRPLWRKMTAEECRPAAGNHFR